MAALQRLLRQEFKRQYFVTGQVDTELYEPGAFFADPTISFRGREAYARNLQLVVPFLLEPRITLLSLRKVPTGQESPSGAAQLRAEWRLESGVALPWSPYVRLQGRTTYTLNEQRSQICRHVEEWSLTPVQALLLLLKPGGKG